MNSVVEHPCYYLGVSGSSSVYFSMIPASFPRYGGWDYERPEASDYVGNLMLIRFDA